MSATKRFAAMPERYSASSPPAQEPDVIKRAFDIASECGSLSELKRRLILEGYLQVNAHLNGWQIRRDLIRRLDRKLKHQIPKRVWGLAER
jgi:hypothetical protein